MLHDRLRNLGYSEDDLDESNPYTTRVVVHKSRACGVTEMVRKMNANELKDALGNFYGTEGYHRFNILTPHVVLTDGAQFLAEKAGAFWLMDVIASHLPRVLRDEYLCVARITKGDTWEFVLGDGDGKIYATQQIEYSDFPFDDFTLYVGRQDNSWVILLPSEY